MSQQLSIKEAERKAFRMTQQDGLWDILLGCVFVSFGITPLLTDIGFNDFTSSAIMYLGIMLIYAAIWAGKKFIIAPRIGRVRFGPVRKKKLKIMTILMIFFLLLGVIVGLIAFTGQNVSSYIFPILFSAVGFISLCAAAYILDYTRLFAYGILFVLAYWAGEMLYRFAGASHHGIPLTFSIAGSMIVLVGAVLFVRFLREFPIPTAENNNGAI